MGIAGPPPGISHGTSGGRSPARRVGIAFTPRDCGAFFAGGSLELRSRGYGTVWMSVWRARSLPRFGVPALSPSVRASSHSAGTSIAFQATHHRRAATRCTSGTTRLWLRKNWGVAAGSGIRQRTTSHGGVGKAMVVPRPAGKLAALSLRILSPDSADRSRTIHDARDRLRAIHRYPIHCL